MQYAAAQMFDQSVEWWVVPHIDAECHGDRRRHEVRICHRIECDEEDAVGKRIELLGRELQCQAGLAGAARSGQGQEACACQEAASAVDLFSSDECRWLDGQVVRPAFEGSQAGEGRREAGDHRLEQALRPRQILQPVLAEIA